MPDFRQALNLHTIPVIGFVPYTSTTAPSNPVDGQLWRNSSTNITYSYNASLTTWEPSSLGVGSVTNAMVAAGAGIAESKLSLASDAAAGTASRRTLGTGAQQAMPGNETLAQIGTANPNGGDVNLNSHKLTNVSDPSSATSQDAATANWVTQAIQNYLNGQDWKSSVALATSAALPANTYAGGVLTATANGALSVDGQAVTVGQRLLIKNEAAPANNGIYVVTATGGAGAPYVLTRSTDANSSTLVTGGMTVPVDSGGTSNAGTVWLLATTEAIVLGTTALNFSQIGGAGASYSAGTGLTLSGNTFSIENGGVLTVSHGGTGASTAAGARTNLGAPGQYVSPAIGDGSSLVLTVTHNLNNQYPNSVTVWDVSGANPVQVFADVTATSVNAITVSFATAPATNSIRVSLSA